MATDVEVPTTMDNSTSLLSEGTNLIETLLNNSELVPPNNSGVIFPNDESVMNTTDNEDSEYLMFEKFVIVEIVMTTLELVISVWAASKMPRWRRNYRNQMLMQLTFARFLKRVIFVFQFLDKYNKIEASEYTTHILSCCQFYIDYVIVILVFFFIKHMYNSLIIVLVKISQNNFYKVLLCSWLIPVPISVTWTTLVATNMMDKWLVYLLICCIFRWPLIFVGTGLYITIVYRILTDKIRHFASSLAVVTFLLCLIINVYLFSKDIIVLWCSSSTSTELISYISGFLLNLLILTLYVILIFLSSNNKTQCSKDELPDYSAAEVTKC